MVKWTDQAKSDLRHLYNYIAQDSKFYAKKVAREIVAKTKLLAEMPQIGKKVPEINDDLVREVHLYSYRVMYEIFEQDIYILGIIHKRRDFEPEGVGK